MDAEEVWSWTAQFVSHAEELYERVWTTPAYRLGPELGLSGRGLAKVCARERVPVPGRGYWVKVQCGQAPKRPPLPPRGETQLGTISFHSVAKPVNQVKSEARAKPDPIPVPQHLGAPHTLIRQTKAALAAAKKGEDGIIRCRDQPCLNVEVGRDSLSRALRILDALVKALERKDYTVEVGYGEGPNDTEW